MLTRAHLERARLDRLTSAGVSRAAFAFRRANKKTKKTKNDAF